VVHGADPVIRHAPAGRGHPYLIDPDQRVPLRPVAGEPFELRAVVSDDVEAVRVELTVEGRLEVIAARLRGPAIAEERTDYGHIAAPAGDGHLTDTARLDAQEGSASWAADISGLPAQTDVCYRFFAGDEPTETFAVTVGEWSPAPAALSLEAPPSVRDRLVEGSVECLTDGELRYRLRFALRLEAGERVVGFGERFDHLDQRGRRVDTGVFDQYKSQGARSYLPMPFAIVVGGGFGFHVDTGRRCFFDVGSSTPDRLVVEVDLEPGEPDAPVRLRLFAGEPADVLRAFAPVADAPAEWVYRLWISGNEWNTQERVLAEVEQAREHGIPVGVVVIEAWSDERTFTVFDDGVWPDPKAMVDELHGHECKVLLWQIPLAPDESDAATMIERGYCVRRADGSPYRNLGGWFNDAVLLDVTNEEAVDWWLSRRRYLVEEIGVDGFKTDGGEHAWGADLVYADGTRGGETNNRYPVLYAAAYHRLAPVTFSRAGFTGAGAYPCHWAGDADSTWAAFRASITAGLTAGASGVFFWGWDLGGFSGELPSVELYLRATAMATFCPIMQLHSEFNFHRAPSRDRTPWNVAEQSGDPRVVPVFRQFAELRERLVPYLADQGAASARHRAPLMRALFFDHLEDENLWRFPYEYMLGDGLLVAPVCEEGRERWPVYLPRGDWFDAWTGERYGGGEIVEQDVPLDRIPVFCDAARADALLPLFEPLQLVEVS
jgi:alpha-glucosidase (family GH31 glycosyl hydrolase)